MLLKAAQAQEWEVQSPPCFWEQPTPPPRFHRQQAGLLTVGQAHPGFHKGLACSQHCTAGRAQLRGGGEHPRSPGPCLAEGRAALVPACRCEGGEAGPPLPADFPAGLSQGSRRKRRRKRGGPGFSSRKAASGGLGVTREPVGAEFPRPSWGLKRAGPPPGSSDAAPPGPAGVSVRPRTWPCLISGPVA